jgi:hypothetical protein
MRKKGNFLSNILGGSIWNLNGVDCWGVFGVFYDAL